MSRIGIQPVEIPEKVDVSIEGSRISVRGPRGELVRDLPEEIGVEIVEGQVVASCDGDNQKLRSLHGLTRSLISNMIEGVIKGYSKKLEIIGVGYRASMKGSSLQLELGFSHPVEIEPPEGISVEIQDNGHILITGNDKQQVGDFAAQIRAIKKPEPYKGKGIRYVGERVRRKVGKTG